MTTETKISPAEKLANEIRSRRKNPGSRSKGRPLWSCKVQELRTALGLPIKAVARECGTTQSTLIAIELGGDLKLTTAMNIAVFFGKRINDLWTPPENGKVLK